MSHQTKTPAKHFANWLKGLSKPDRDRQYDIGVENTVRILAAAPTCNTFYNDATRTT